MRQQPLNPRQIINSDHGKLVSCNCIVASVSSKYSLRMQVDNSYNTVFFGISGVVISGTCVGTYAPSNYIMSPNYPQDYGYNVDCRWLISLPGIKNFKLTLLDFETGSSHSLNVYEGQNVHGALLTAYSGSSPSPTRTGVWSPRHGRPPPTTRTSTTRSSTTWENLPWRTPSRRPSPGLEWRGQRFSHGKSNNSCFLTLP